MKDILTGKNKEQFEKWYFDNSKNNYHLLIIERITKGSSMELIFEDLPFEMQIGVLLSYYDSLGYDIEKSRYMDDELMITEIYEVCIFDYTLDTWLLFESLKDDVNEAYREAFIKANEIINNLIFKKQQK